MRTLSARIGTLGLAAVSVSAAWVMNAPIAGADPPDIVLNEIHYNPESGLDADEFVEIYNAGATRVELGDWCVRGIDFCFPVGATIGGGEFLVISPDATRLRELYGVPSAGTYGGRLKNSGEQVTLIDAIGNVVHSLEYGDRGIWPVLPDGGGPSLELAALDARSSAWSWLASTAKAGHTAGGPNSTTVSGTPPSITDVIASTTSPASGEEIVISATIENAISTPRLVWRTNLGDFTSIAMTGDAPHFTAAIPGRGAGDLVEYSIETEGVFDHTWPRVDDSTRTVGIYCARAIESAIPVFEWFIDDDDYDSMVKDHLLDEMFFDSVLVVGEEVMTGSNVRVRGRFTREDRKPQFKWEFPRNHDLIAPGLLDGAIDEFAMQSDYADRSYGRSLLSWKAYEMVGIPTAQTFKIRVERNGEFYGLYSYLDVFDGNWRQRHHLREAGSLYKARESAFARRWSLLRRWELKEGSRGYAPLVEMLEVILSGTPAEREAYVRANFDVEQMIDYAAVTALARHADSSSKNFYAFKSDATGKWRILPWDLDHTWGGACCRVASAFVSPSEPGDRVNRMLEALLDIDELETQYFARVAELRDRILSPGLLEGIFDAEVAVAAPEAALDKAKWGRCCTVSSDRSKLFDAIQARRDAFDSDPRVGGDG